MFRSQCVKHFIHEYSQCKYESRYPLRSYSVHTEHTYRGYIDALSYLPPSVVGHPYSGEARVDSFHGVVGAADAFQRGLPPPLLHEPLGIFPVVRRVNLCVEGGREG